MKISHDFDVFEGQDEPRNGFGFADQSSAPSQNRQRPVASPLAHQARQIVVSDEIVGILGHGRFAWVPSDVFFLCFADDECFTRADVDPIFTGNDPGVGITFAISHGACSRLFGFVPPLDERWHMPGELRALGQLLVAITKEDEASHMLRAARSTELICALFAALSEGRLVKVRGATTLREREIALVVAAHKIVSEDWREPLTVGGIARRCGMSRSKLTRGYREIYRRTVGEAVSERRLEAARRLLAESDLHISTVGYRCGYTNNASFSRAFSRHFGMTPTAMRRHDKRAWYR